MKKWLVVLFLLVSSLCWATAVPDHPSGRVSDYAGMFSQAVVNEVTGTLENYEKQTTNQIAVATFNSLEGGNLEDFSIKLAEKWKIGQKDKNNGVILVIFKDDHKLRIEVGYGLEPTLTDAKCQGIIQNAIVPNFKAGDYDAGLKAGVSQIIGTLSGKESEQVKDQDTPNKPSAKMIFIILGILVVVIIIVAIFTFGDGGFFFGGGGSDDSDDSGGGGGGGSFGGGGASGGW